MKIEYLDKFKRLERVGGHEGVLELFRARREMRREYSFAIPTEKAILELVALSPVVEMGAGTGYWSMLIREAGGEVLSFDKYLGEVNKYAFTKSYGVVQQGDENSLQGLGGRYCLLLCWPNYNTNFAYNCVVAFLGNRLVYIGEGEGGCNANLEFFHLLGKDWTVTKNIDLPQWPGLNDRLSVYQRNVPLSV